MIKPFMEAMGARPNGSPKTFVAEGVVLIRNIGLIIGTCVAATVWIMRIVQAPERVTNLEDRLGKVEISVIKTDEKVSAIGADVRDIKQILMQKHY
jgi:ABC-type lipoprotein release transport system permease subunit